MTVFKYLLFAVVFPATVLAQRMSHPVMVSRDDAFSAPRMMIAASDTVHVLAVLVQFQKDADLRTTGDGQLVLSAPTDSVIDAPPHNAQYFRDHLTFLHNYFQKASRGRVIIQSTVLDSIVTLPAPMSAYSPPKSGPNDAVAHLARDTWSKVDSSGFVADFSRYDCFVVFHAGVGRDIDLLSLLGYDPGPSDIPSLYFGLNAFRAVYGSGYQGIPVSGGAFHITNSIVAPETESRTIPALVGTALLEFSINGLLCASFGNFLGLPDLFDTNTGRSGIGRFGLMDGQAIFSFGGVFPPLPSAWERYWLGWSAPITVGSGTTTISLPAIEVADTVYRVPISNEEYFLVENRNRDPQQPGQRVWSTFNGMPREQFFLRDTTGFASADISLLSGVVTDVEDLDWSLPGGVDQNGTFYDGGVLIWHIDESIIQQGLATDGVNANPDRRGVDLEEADGSQDIGQQYAFLTAGSGSEEGTALDFWFLGNASPVNKNEFSTTSMPDSRSNSGANSHVTIKDFSVRSPRMSASITRGDSRISVLPGFPRSTGEFLTPTALTVATLTGWNFPSVMVTTTGTSVPARTVPDRLVPPPPVEGKLYLWSTTALTATPPFSSSGLVARTGVDRTFIGAASVADTNADGKGDLIILGQLPVAAQSSFPNLLRGLVLQDANGDSLADDRLAMRVPRRISTPAFVNDSMLVVGMQGGTVAVMRPGNPVIGIFSGLLLDTAATVVGVSGFIDVNRFVITGGDGTVALALRSPLGDVTATRRNFGAPIAGPAATASFGAGPGIAFVTTTGLLYLVDASLNPFPGFPVNLGGPVNAPPALADIDGDGLRDIVVCSGSKIYAFNHAGVSLDYFPVSVPVVAQGPLTSAPIVADVDGDGLVDIVAATRDGLVVAVNRKGTMAGGFPLQAGRGTQAIAVFAYEPSIYLFVASSDDGSVSGWITGSISGAPLAANYPWPQYQRDAGHGGVDAAALTGAPLSSDFFPKDRAYNWPNPVYDGKTHIRYFVRETASVSVKIFDLAGDLVTSFSGPGVGGIDNEVDWDVSGVQSGVYLARIEASGSGGSGVVIVKVAVVK
jgi:hypothetical protein